MSRGSINGAQFQMGVKGKNGLNQEVEKLRNATIVAEKNTIKGITCIKNNSKSSKSQGCVTNILNDGEVLCSEVVTISENRMKLIKV